MVSKTAQSNSNGVVRDDNTLDSQGCEENKVIAGRKYVASQCPFRRVALN